MPGHKDLLANLKKVTDVYFDYKQVKDYCYNAADEDASGELDAAGWNVLACNELAMPMSMGTAETTMFVPRAWDETAYNTECQAKYGIMPKYDWAWTEFGGMDFRKDFKQYSNIMFSNGDLDPWYAGGVTDFVSYKLPYAIIRGGAHHLDLREPNEADPSDAVWVRQQHSDLIK